MRILLQSVRRSQRVLALFTLMEEGRQACARDRVDLITTTQDAIAACQHVAHADRIRLLGANVAPLWVEGDRTALQHAILNVIENAAKYSPADSPSARGRTAATWSRCATAASASRTMGRAAFSTSSIAAAT